MRVDFQRCFQIAVAHKVLRGFYIDAGIVKHRAIGVPQHLGSNVFDDRHTRFVFGCRLSTCRYVQVSEVTFPRSLVGSGTH